MNEIEGIPICRFRTSEHGPLYVGVIIRYSNGAALLDGYIEWYLVEDRKLVIPSIPYFGLLRDGYMVLDANKVKQLIRDGKIRSDAMDIYFATIL